MHPIEFNGIWKKYRRGEKFYALRDLIPFLVKDILSSKHSSREVVEGLAKDEFWVLKDINFEVKKGEIFGIIGHNGAGKSTILKLLSKIIKPYKGQVNINGRLSALIEVTAGFHPDFTGRENIYFNGAVYGMKKVDIDRKFDQIVDFSGVREFIDTPVKRYSSGMSARLGFAIASHVDPDILLVDEVLSVGDMNFQSRCIDKIKELLKEGKTIVFVSHSISLVQTLCQRVILLEKGQIVKQGTPQEVIPFYETSVLKDQEAALKKKLNKIGDKVELGQSDVCVINEIRVLNHKKEEKEYFDFAEPLSGYVEYEIKGQPQDITIQYEIVRADGVNCLAGNTLDDEIVLANIQGKNKISFSLEGMPIAAGAYYLKISVWDKGMINSFVVQRKVFNIKGKELIYLGKTVFTPQASWKNEAISKA